MLDVNRAKLLCKECTNWSNMTDFDVVIIPTWKNTKKHKIGEERRGEERIEEERRE